MEVDLRDHPLERKRILERVAAGHRRILIAKHIETRGTDLFRAVCLKDLVVSKWNCGRYGEGWFKILNPSYTQRAGREELFKRRGAAA